MMLSAYVELDIIVMREVDLLWPIIAWPRGGRVLQRNP